MTGPKLTSPFKNESRDPRGYTYIPVEDVIERLNMVLGVGQWSYECETANVDDRGITVKGRLSACGGVYEQYGGQNYNRFSDSHKTQPGEVMDMGNDFKGAASDALKKCAQQIGVGLYIPLEHSPRFEDPSGVVTAGSGGRAESAPPAPPADSGSLDEGAARTPPVETAEETVPSPSPPPPKTADSGTTNDGRKASDKPDVEKPAKNTPETAGAPGSVAPADSPPDTTLEKLEAQGLIQRLNDLPLAQKALALQAKKQFIGPDWFTCPPESLAAMRGRLTELEAEVDAAKAAVS